jgi:hypothetical protein
MAMHREELKPLKISPTKDKLTMAAGLGTLIELFDSSPLKKEFMACLPERTSHRSVGSYQMALTLMAAFLYGYDCLEDLDQFRNDPTLAELFGNQTAAARTHGDFLRDFEPENLLKLNRFLNRMSRYIFEQMQVQLPEQFKPKKLIVDVDSTSHEQHGEKMEGLAFNYKNEWCLDSQVSFNQIGLCHGFQLRPGNTKSGVDAESLIRQSFTDGKKQIERKFQFNDFFRADSAYCKQDVIKALVELGVQFTLTAHDGTTNWKEILEKTGVDWSDWIYTPAEIERAQKSQKELPQIQVARMYWTPKWSEKEESKLMFPILVKRTWNKDREEELKKRGRQASLFHNDGFQHEDPWDYYGIVTNFALDLSTDKVVDKSNNVEKMKRWSIQEVLEHHQKRGNAENFIKEEKYGYDLKHFPCLKLNANYAYGLLAMVAHNILRWVAIMTSPDKPHFSKKLRKHFVFIPGKIVHHARQVFLKMMEFHFKGVQELRERLGLNSKRSPQQFSSA